MLESIASRFLISQLDMIMNIKGFDVLKYDEPSREAIYLITLEEGRYLRGKIRALENNHKSEAISWRLKNAFSEKDPEFVKAMVIKDCKVFLEKYSRPTDIVRLFDEYIIGQQKTKEAFAIALYNHAKRIICSETNDNTNPNKPEKCLLVIGGSGQGKSAFYRVIKTIAPFPCNHAGCK